MPEVVPIKAPLGARIEGLERISANDPDAARLLNRALAEHLLVVIPGERMEPARTRCFAEAFGQPQKQLLRYKRSGEVPDVSIMVSTIMADGTTDKTAIRAEDWHTDDSYFAKPAKATLLHAIEIPSRGGSTWFCAVGANGAGNCRDARCRASPGAHASGDRTKSALPQLQSPRSHRRPRA